MGNATEFAIETGKQLARTGCDALRFKAKLDDAMLDPMAYAKRTLRKGRYATEDLLDETRLAIRKQPVTTVAIAFGLAFGIGAIAGALVKRS